MISMILATDESGGIGYKNSLPWPKVESDLKWFKEKTLNEVVVMGRKTWISLGDYAPLPERINYVISSSDFKLFEGAYDSYDHTKYSLETIVQAIQSRHPKRNIMIVGGKTLYDELYKIADTIYLTTIKGTYEVDTSVNRTRYLELFDRSYQHQTEECTFEIWNKKEYIKQQQDPRHNQW